MEVEVGPAGATEGIIHYSSYNAGEGERKAEGRGGVSGPELQHIIVIDKTLECSILEMIQVHI